MANQQPPEGGPEERPEEFTAEPTEGAEKGPEEGGAEKRPGNRAESVPEHQAEGLPARPEERIRPDEQALQPKVQAEGQPEPASGAQPDAQPEVQPAAEIQAERPAEAALILLRHREIAGIAQLDVYRQHGGFEAFENVVTGMQPGQVTEAVKASGLRGRGGAGFPTGMKWSFMDNQNWPHYVVVNADESEPGTFKDREIMEFNPLQFLEGVMICAYAVGANLAYIYLRGEFWPLAGFLDGKIAELEAAGLLGDKLFGTEYALRLVTHLGAGAYICGEETALLESLEGKLGQPRLRPPFPPSFGLYGKPTVVNNVETLTNLPLIMQRGPEWYRSYGTEKSPGNKVFSLSGNIHKPGNYELPLGTTFRELIYTHGGGIPGGRKVKAIMAAGASSALIVATEEALDTPMDYESVPKLGAQLGSASMIVIDETVSIDWLINKTTHFFKHESCGKCTPCREGTYWMVQISDRITHGKAGWGDVELLREVANQIKGKCLCALGEFSIEAVLSGIERFPGDFEAHGGRTPAGEAQAARSGQQVEKVG